MHILTRACVTALSHRHGATGLKHLQQRDCVPAVRNMCPSLTPLRGGRLRPWRGTSERKRKGKRKRCYWIRAHGPWVTKT
ncbi:hypothetical protein CesoFtcFv8_013481 [Champsocephalus esox]|uniref:Uncharacterized protein n=1 Tax=Champsocephalus esox TaxID=159716 RepID=A0AAN8BQW0_9TELE|nr:hypothetical protein CesoFtcFv8_013481 [Champsocephalus esox]